MADKFNIAPLSIKTDENNKAVPLGIKSTPEGLKEFTNWENLSNSIDELGRFGREDSFKNNKRVTASSEYQQRVTGETALLFQKDNTSGTYQIDDQWDVNKVKILDNFAFVAQDEYTDLQKISFPTMRLLGRQYFVQRNFTRFYEEIIEDNDEESVPGFTTWNVSGTYTAHMPLILEPATVLGDITITYVPSSNTWTVVGSVPDSRTYSGAFIGTAEYDACSGGGATNVDVTITGSHLCTATMTTQTFTGTVRLNISPGNSADEATCSSDIVINSISFGTPSLYSSSGGCHISYATSTISDGTYTPPVEPDTRVSQATTSIIRKIGSLSFRLNKDESNIFQEYAFTKPGDVLGMPREENQDFYKRERLVSPTEADFSNLIIRFEKEVKRTVKRTGNDQTSNLFYDNYLRFGGFISNDFAKSNDYVRMDDLAQEEIIAKQEKKSYEKPEVIRDIVTLKTGVSGPINKSTDSSGFFGNVNLATTPRSEATDCPDEPQLLIGGDPPPDEFVDEGLQFWELREDGAGFAPDGSKKIKKFWSPLGDFFGDFMPPEKDQLKDDWPLNYSTINAKPRPSWNRFDLSVFKNETDGGQAGMTDWQKFLVNIGYGCRKDIGDKNAFIAGSQLLDDGQTFKHPGNSRLGFETNWKSPASTQPRDPVVTGEKIVLSDGQGIFQKFKVTGNCIFQGVSRASRSAGLAFNESRNADLNGTREAWRKQNFEENKRTMNFLPPLKGSASRGIGETDDIPVENVIGADMGFYYVIIDDSDPDRPFVAGIQMDFALNSVGDGTSGTSQKYYEDEDGLRDFQKGLHFTEDTYDIQFVKLMPIRQCGKVDVYSKGSLGSATVSTPLQYVGHGSNFVLADHGFEDNQIIKISGALYKEFGVPYGVRDSHPLNGTFKVHVKDESNFSLLPGGKITNADGEVIEWDNPPSQEDMLNLRSLEGVLYQTLDMADPRPFARKEGENWKFESSIYSPTGKNGYFKKLFGVEESNSDDILADESDFILRDKADPLYDVHNNGTPRFLYQGIQYISHDLIGERASFYGQSGWGLAQRSWSRITDISNLSKINSIEYNPITGNNDRENFGYAYQGRHLGLDIYGDVTSQEKGFLALDGIQFKDNGLLSYKRSGADSSLHGTSLSYGRGGWWQDHSILLYQTIATVAEVPDDLSPFNLDMSYWRNLADQSGANGMINVPGIQDRFKRGTIKNFQKRMREGDGFSVPKNSIENVKNLSLGPDQLYPYVNGTDAEYAFQPENYKGTRFGCDLDVKKDENGHYIIAIGEKGSDVSVNLFGMDTTATKAKYFSQLNGEIVEMTLYGQRDKFTSQPVTSPEESLIFRGHRRYIPQYLPYGKTHIVRFDPNPSVDNPNFIHENTLFGGGHSIKSIMNENIISGRSEHSLEKNPWFDIEKDFRVDKGDDSIYRVSEISRNEILISEQDFLDKNYVVDRSRYWQRHAVMHWYPQAIPEILGLRDNFYISLGRKKEAHGYEFQTAVNERQNEFLRVNRDFFLRSSTDYPLKRNFGGAYRTVSDGTNFSDYVSIFGDDPNIVSIDRFNVNNDELKIGFWSIFPWVDSFGKSVGLSIDSNLKDVIGSSNYSNGSKMTVLSASTSRCNIDITDEVEQPIANLTKDQIKPGDGKYKAQDSESQIGQLNAHFVYKNIYNNDYDVVDYMQINSAGSMGGRYRRGLSRKYKRRRVFDPTDRSSIRYTQLPRGTYAGHGIAEVMTSCYMSYSDIVFDKDRIIFSEQSLGENKSIIHIFDFNALATLPFRKKETIERQFNFPRNSEFTTDQNKQVEAGFEFNDSGVLEPVFDSAVKILNGNNFNVGDGFGMCIRADKDLLLTNATDIFDEFNQRISSTKKFFNTVAQYGVDQIFLYERLKENFEFIQKITPTVTSKELYKNAFGTKDSPSGFGIRERVKKNRFGHVKMGNNFQPALWQRNRLGFHGTNSVVPLAAMNYDNNPNGSFAWVLGFAGRYDVCDGRIVLQDPYSVAVFDRDFGQTDPMVGIPYSRTPQIKSAKIETFDHQDTSKLTYEDVTGSRTRSGSVENLYDCRINIQDYQGGSRYSRLPEQVPILNYDLENDQETFISKMTIRFNVSADMNDISTTLTPRVERRTDQPLIPRVVLYKKDPETLVTRNRSSKILENAANVSNFYTLDTSKLTKSKGGFIAPTKSASDFESPVKEGITFYNNSNATETHRDAGFMGQFRGGAQDLFFYGTLDESIPENAQEVFGGSDPRITLPYLYGGEKNLADFTDGCSWIAPDVYHKYDLDQLSSIAPYAKIYKPEKIGTNTYEVTITSEDINFGEFTENGGIWLGFLLTNINSFDIATSRITYEEFFFPDSDLPFNSKNSPNEIYSEVEADGLPSSDKNIGPFRYISAATIDGTASEEGFIRSVSDNWINARYPYCKVGIYPAISSGKGSQTQRRRIKSGRVIHSFGPNPAKSLNCFAEITVSNPSVSLKGFSKSGRRYKTSFSRRAVVSLNDIFTQPSWDGFGGAKVAIGKSSKRYGFYKNYSILTATNGYILDVDKEYSLDGNPLTVDLYDQKRLRHSNILSSFDIERPEYLSLTIKGLPLEDNFATLFTPTASEGANALTSLVLTPAKQLNEATTTLFTGIRDFDGVEPLFLSNKLSENKFTLNINEIQPSAVVPFFTKTVNASGGVDLAFAPPTTGSAPLFVTGPIAASGLAPLNTVGGAFMDEIFTLRLSGAFHSSGDAPFFTYSHFDQDNVTTLNFAPPLTGFTPLYINSNAVASGQATLTIFDKASGVQALNLFTGDQFDVENKALDLFLRPRVPPTGQAPLNTTGFALSADSNRNSVSNFLLDLPENLFDKGRLLSNGVFNARSAESSIERTISGKTTFSNSALLSHGQGPFYEYNKNLVKIGFLPRTSYGYFNTKFQTDPFSPSIFTNQRQGVTRYKPSDKKRGTLDPAYNLAIGAYSTNPKAKTFSLSGADSENPPYFAGGVGVGTSLDYIQKYFTGNQESGPGTFMDKSDLRTGYTQAELSRFNDVTFRYDAIEKEFYDHNEKMLVSAKLSEEDIIDIQIRDIDDDGNVFTPRGRSTSHIRTSPASMPLHTFVNEAGKEDAEIKQGTKIGGIPLYYTRENIPRRKRAIGVPQATSRTSLPTDMFYKVREEIFTSICNEVRGRIFTERGTITSAYYYGVKMEILGLKVSNNGICALSFRAKSNYEFYYSTSRKKRKKHRYIESNNFILVFDVKQSNSFGFFKDQNIYSTGFNYSLITSIGGGGFGLKDHPFNATSMAFDNLDNLYVNTVRSTRPFVGSVVIHEKEHNYRFFGNIAGSFSDTGKDFTEYNSSSNLRLLKNETPNFGGQNLTGFGHKVKIFEEGGTDGEIMAVSAPLFDPFMLNGLNTHTTGTHFINPMGAVYIYKKGKDEENWNYHGAVYAKGYTSANIMSNISEFRGGKIGAAAGKPQVSLFGYDFDYCEDVLSVTAPGGDGAGTVEAGKVYSFNISSTPVLTKTYSASDITINSSPIEHGDNFGTHIACFDKNNIFVFSDATLINNPDNFVSGTGGVSTSQSTLRNEGESLIHNLENNSSFGFCSGSSSEDLQYSKQNDFNELIPYFTSGLKSGSYSDSLMQVWSRILSIKKLSVKNKDRLLVVRKFAFRLKAFRKEDHFDNSFDVIKLQVVDLERSVNGTLFIKAPNSADSGSLAPLYSLAPGPSGNFDMVIKPIAYPSGLTSLFVDNRNIAADMPLHTPRISDDGNIFLPFAMNAFAPTASGDFRLFLKHQVATATPDLFMPVVGIENSGISFIAEGTSGEGVSASPSLVINRTIPAETDANIATLFLNQTNFNTTTLVANNAGSDNPAVDLFVSSPSILSASGAIPLSVKTFVPPIGPGGGFVGSGIITIAMSGNNDANVYSNKNKDISLVLPARGIENLGNVLFIEKSFGGISPLYMDSRIASGDVVLNVEGVNIQESNVNLNTRGGTALVGLAESGNFNAFTRGWFD